MFDVKEAIKAKTKIQDRILEISKTEEFILLNLITGSGKTLASLKIAEYFNDVKWLILCKETTHIEEWKKEIEKHNIKIDYDIICYASLHKIKGKYNIICDEAHAITIKKRNQIKKNIKFKRGIFLSATLPENKVNHIKVLSKNKFKTLTLNLDDAIRLKMLPKPTINVYQIRMSKSQQTKYDNINKQVREKSYIYKEDKTTKNYESLMFIANKRKDIVANFKIKYVKDLIRKLNKDKTRFICFCNSIKQLDILRNGSEYYIHSLQDSDKKNQEIINEFNDKKSNHLFTVKMLTESANLNAIEQGILVQLDKEPLTTNQRIGRVLRANIPIISTFVVKGTMDEYYIKNSLQNINQKYIKYYEK